MEPDVAWGAETIEFATSDGLSLTGDLARPDDPRVGAVDLAVAVCHPHPQYGGNRHDHVVDACWRALAEAGVAALRFDFRAEYGLGETERLDVIGALDALAEAHPDARLAVVGYSFGAMVALGTADSRLIGRVLIAPPLGRMQIEPAGSVPTLVLAPAHDQFTPPDTVREIVDRWAVVNPAASHEVIEMADHFLHGRAGHAAERTVAWLRGRPPF